MINNRISDIINRIRNAIKNSNDGFIIHHNDLFNSIELLGLLTALSNLGVLEYKNNSWYLLYYPNTSIPILYSLNSRSKSSKRIYRPYSKILLSDIIRTSKGIITGQQAHSLKLGGEVIISLNFNNPLKT